MLFYASICKILHQIVFLETTSDPGRRYRNVLKGNQNSVINMLKMLKALFKRYKT
jgi:hypothetical protein